MVMILLNFRLLGILCFCSAVVRAGSDSHRLGALCLHIAEKSTCHVVQRIGTLLIHSPRLSQLTLNFRGECILVSLDILHSVLQGILQIIDRRTDTVEDFLRGHSVKMVEIKRLALFFRFIFYQLESSLFPILDRCFDDIEHQPLIFQAGFGIRQSGIRFLFDGLRIARMIQSRIDDRQDKFILRYQPIIELFLPIVETCLIRRTLENMLVDFIDELFRFHTVRKFGLCFWLVEKALADLLQRQAGIHPILQPCRIRCPIEKCDVKFCNICLRHTDFLLRL